jgi:hypothetical protein
LISVNQWSVDAILDCFGSFQRVMMVLGALGDQPVNLGAEVLIFGKVFFDEKA